MLRSESPSRPTGLDDLLDAKLVSRLSQLDLASRRVFTGRLKGERRSKKRGESVEFADHRPYVSGDDIRFIDWNIYGRLDRLFLKMFMEEEDLSLHLVVDCSASMGCGEPEKFGYCQRLAAALGYIGMVNLNRVTLTAIGAPKPEDGAAPAVRSVIRNLRGRRRAGEMGAWLCGLEPDGVSRFDEACKRIALTRTGKGVMVVLSDFFFKEGYEQGLRMLVGRGFDVFCMQTLAPQEVEPTLGGDLRLKDIEDADIAEVTISAPLLKRYKENLAAYCDQWRQFCARRDIATLTIRTDTPVETVILDYLRTRGLLR
jgi:uncharacterized protein (DUF58 family)